MTKEQILKNIEECIKYNKAARQAECGDLYKDATRRSNEVLARAKHHIANADEYERGANEAWELARKVTRMVSEGGYTMEEIRNIFDVCCVNDVFDNFTIQEALAKVQAYEKKKEEEAAKPKLGDVVEVHYVFNEVIEKGIFLSEGIAGFNYLDTEGRLIQARYQSNVMYKKTGEHVDIQGMLDKIG